MALAVFNYNNYEPKDWNIMLIMWAFILVPLVFDVWFKTLVNAFELIGRLLHIIFFMVSIWYHLGHHGGAQRSKIRLLDFDAWCQRLERSWSLLGFGIADHNILCLR